MDALRNIGHSLSPPEKNNEGGFSWCNLRYLFSFLCGLCLASSMLAFNRACVTLVTKGPVHSFFTFPAQPSLLAWLEPARHRTQCSPAGTPAVSLRAGGQYGTPP